MDVYSGALYIVARLTRHSRGKTWLQNRILDTAALTAVIWTSIQGLESAISRTAVSVYGVPSCLSVYPDYLLKL